MGGAWLTSHEEAIEGLVEGLQCGGDDTKEWNDAARTGGMQRNRPMSDAQRNCRATAG
jgi:hypothetical protein